jgi:hypothetical protein
MDCQGIIFAQAFLQGPPPCILGRQLLPFCAGHALILETLGNRFLVDSDGPETLDDLIIAVYFCSRSYTEGKKTLADGANYQSIRKWADECNPEQLRHAPVMFRQYLADYTALPELWSAPEKDAPLVTPYPIAVAVGAVVATKGAISIDDALEMPITRIVCITLAAGELTGSNRLKTPGEVETIRTGEHTRYTPGAAPKPAALRQKED